MVRGHPTFTRAASGIPASRKPIFVFILKPAGNGRKKAQKAQKEKDGVETGVTHTVKVIANAKPSISILCAFCAFSCLTAFSRFIFVSFSLSMAG